jgi:hypothetical protein
MPLRKTLFVICLVLCVLCLAAGYALAGGWGGAALSILIGPAWWFARKFPTSWGPFFCLFGSAGLAVAGILLGSPPVFMISGSAAALAAWDLVWLESAVGGQPEMEQTRQYEKEHLRSLAQAVGGGLSGELLGRLIRVDIPFIVLMSLSIFLVFALDRVWSYVKKTGKS